MTRKSTIATLLAQGLTVALAGRAAAQICSTNPATTDDADVFIFRQRGGFDPVDFDINNPTIWFAPDYCNTQPNGCIVAGTPPNADYDSGTSFALDIALNWHVQVGDGWGHPDGESADGAQRFNPNVAFNKLLDTAYLVGFGLKDDVNQSWHGTQDYVALTNSGDTAYHSNFFRALVSNGNFFGQFQRNLIGDDELDLSCSLFNGSSTSATFANPASRAATNVHETWHAWENKNFHAGGVAHQECPAGSSLGAACDPFYPHTLETFRPFGTLYQASFSQALTWLPAAYTANVADPNKFHSPNQIAFEFLCDLITNHADWVPAEIITEAQARAHAIATERLINMPPMDCGNGRPFP